MQLDNEILLWINSHYCEMTDTFFWHATKKEVWLPLYLGLVFVFRSLYKTDSLAQVRTSESDSFTVADAFAPFRAWLPCLVAIAAVGAAAGLADLISSGILKHLFERPRPSHEPALIGLVRILHDYRGGQFGFPSSHAADTMAVAVSTLFLLRRSALSRQWLVACYVVLPLYVAINCYSRMYLGVHYPSDIAVGLLIGLAVGLLCGALGQYVLRKISR